MLIDVVAGVLAVLALLAVILFLALVPDLFGLNTPVCGDPGCGCTGLAGDTTHVEPVADNRKPKNAPVR